MLGRVHSLLMLSFDISVNEGRSASVVDMVQATKAENISSVFSS